MNFEVTTSRRDIAYKKSQIDTKVFNVLHFIVDAFSLMIRTNVSKMKSLQLPLEAFLYAAVLTAMTQVTDVYGCMNSANFANPQKGEVIYVSFSIPPKLQFQSFFHFLNCKTSCVTCVSTNYVRIFTIIWKEVEFSTKT